MKEKGFTAEQAIWKLSEAEVWGLLRADSLGGPLYPAYYSKI
jgi:hypothetical protein